MRTGEYGKVQHTASGRQSGVSRRFRLALSARRPTTYAQLDACSLSLVWLLLLLRGLDTRGQCAPENPSQRGIYLASSVRLLAVKRAPHQGLIVACGTARMNYRHLTFMGSRVTLQVVTSSQSPLRRLHQGDIMIYGAKGRPCEQAQNSASPRPGLPPGLSAAANAVPLHRASW
ncbi:hypothetical protein DFP72DRAFT_100015 [Ephemerocybe angulata]|uniref:Uncharacterized protein n=1 Tax=Ephemerocybe angulata TaxID=980116 RepID=A0A8H6I9W4_9AGAR|nr:hypothetical protein DFP72DRAFT_100015 [Tulosesus angulatus]